MKFDRRRLFSSTLSVLLLVAMLTGYAAPFGAMQNAAAQEATPETTPEGQPATPATPEVTEPAPVVPPTEPTAAPPTATPEATLPQPTENPFAPQLYVEDFQDGAAQGWLLSAGWALATDGAETFLATRGAFETGALQGLAFEHGMITAQIGLEAGNAANIAFRVGQDNYNVTLNADGQASLYQGLTLLAAAPAPLVSEITAPAPTFSSYVITMQIVGGQIDVTVNGVAQISYAAPAPLPAGMVIFSTGQANTGLVTLDNVQIEQMPLPLILPTPTAPPTLEATPTPEATALIEVTAEPTLEVTPEMTPEATPETPESTPEAPVGSAPLLVADFEGELVDWALSETGARIVEHQDGHALMLETAGTFAPGSVLFLTDFRIEADVLFADGEISLLFRSSEGRAYQLVLSSTANTLYRLGQDDALIEVTPEATAEATPDAAPDAAPSAPAEAAEMLVSAPAIRAAETWYTVQVEVIGGQINVRVDDAEALAYTDEAPLLGGEFAFAGGGAAAMVLDNVAVYDLAETGPVVETPTPIVLTDANRLKLTGALANVLLAHLDGRGAEALALATDHFMTLDELSRVKVVVWGVPGTAGTDVAALVEAGGGAILSVGGRSVEAFVTFDGLLALVNQEVIAGISLPEAAVSTGPTNSEAPSTPQAGGGTIRPHTLDTLSVNSWHTYLGPDGTALAGVTGLGVEVGVIDTGFAGTLSAEQGCLGSGLVEGGAGGTNHGLNVVEIICDIAPNASVYMYRAGSGAELITALQKASGQAANGSGFPASMDVIVIAIDTGVATGGDIAGAIASAALNGNSGLGIPVIAAAGNTGESDALFDFAGGTTDVVISTSAGALVSYAWDDPTGTAVYASTLAQNGSVIDSQQVRQDVPAFQYVVPASCGEACDLTLSISGDAPTQIELRVAGGAEDSTVALADGSEMNQPQALAVPANAPNAIAVGAVCAGQDYFDLRYPLVSNSSRGSLGQANNGSIKPELVAPSFVQTSFNPAEPECEGAGFGGTSASAAHVAGMAALLLSNNNNVTMAGYFSTQRAARVEAYLMTRSIDLTDDPTTAQYDATQFGFDRFYGAGLAVLGNPNFNIAEQVNFSSAATPTGRPEDALLGGVAGTAIYVGTATLPTGATIPDGTPNRPYVHPQQAIQVALAQNKQFVIFQPGEYASGIVLGDITANPGDTTVPLAQNLNLISYAEADLGVSLSSSIWVNDTYKGTGGILVQDLIGSPTVGLAINGFDFTGAAPLYLTNAPTLRTSDVTPVYISGSVNVSLLNNTFDRFDRPVIIEDSNNISIVGNTFNSFQIAQEQRLIDGQLRIVPRWEAAVLDISDTGNSTANSVRLYDNTFTNNTIFNQAFFDRDQEPLVSCVRSTCDIRTSRFENNVSQAIILANQWNEAQEPSAPLAPGQKAALITGYPLTVFSSLFVNNTLSGPLVHLYQQNQFRFVNNTLARNSLANNSEVSAVALVGHNATLFTHIDDQRVEMHNNLFFANAIVGGLLSSDGESLGAEGCKQLGVAGGGGQPRNGARNNWFIPYFSPDACGPSTGGAPGFTGLGVNSNQFTALDIADPSAIAAFEQARFFMDFDPENPYRLRPLDINMPNDPTPPQGVDAGGNSFALAIIGTYDPVLTVDVMGLPRIIDRTGPLPFVATPGCPECVIDIGAYELSIADPVSYIDNNGNFTVTTQEDAPSVVIRLDQRVRGGFRPYSFTITNPPTIYNTDPTSPCGGQPYLYNIDPGDPDSRYRLTYCPPLNFHTGSTTPQEVRDAMRFTYQAAGLIVTTPTTPAFISININPVDDAPPQTVSTKQVVFSQVGATLNYRLRPYVDFFPNFSVSDAQDVDYTWTFSNVQIRTGAGQSSPDWGQAFGVDNAATLAALNADITDGRINLTPNPGWEGVVEFSYSVRDSDPGAVTTNNARILRIVITRKLATAGLYDDASLSFVYDESWVPFYYEPAINNTLHYTTTPDAETTFYFVGDAFLLQYYGFPFASDFEVLIDPDDSGPLPERLYNAAQFNLTCLDPAKPSRLTANYPVLATLTFGCKGLNSIVEGSNSAAGQLHRVTIRHKGLSGQALVIDAMTVRNETLTPGLYEEWDRLALDFGPTASTWLDYVAPGPVGGGIKYTFTPAANLEFVVDGSQVSSVVVYRTVLPGAGEMDVFINGVLRTTIPSDYPLFLWAQPFVISNLPGGNVAVEIRKSAGSAGVAIEAIELVAPTDPLPIGSYIGEDERLRYLGSWVNYAGAGPADSTLRYSSDPNAAVVFTINGNGVIINHTQAASYGQFEVCVGTSCQTFNAFNPGLVWSAPAIVRSGTTGVQAVTIRKLDGAFVGIDSVEVLDDLNALTPGFYDENNREFYYSGAWATFLDVLAQGGSFAYTSGTQSSLTFQMDASAMDRLAIIYPTFPGYGSIQVCGNACTSFSQNAAAYRPGTITFVTKASLGYTNETNATVTIRSFGGGIIAVEAIQIIDDGPLTPGYYEETLVSTGFNITYGGTDTLGDGYGAWSPLVLGNLRGGNMVYANTTTATAVFTVIPDQIAGITIYYATGNGSPLTTTDDYGAMQVFSGGSGTCTPGSNCFEINNIPSTGYVTGRSIFITKAQLGLGAGTNPVQITLRPKTNGLFAGLEGLAIVDANPLVAPNDPLTALPNSGITSATDARIQYIGPWLDYIAPGPILGVTRYSLDTTAAIRFKIDGQGVAIYRTLASSYGAMEVCIGQPIPANCQTFNNQTAETLFAQPVVLRSATSGIQIVEIRNVATAAGFYGYVGIEGIEVLGAQATLPVNTVIEETNTNLRYTGTWVPFTGGVGTQGGRLNYTLDTASTLTFQVNATQFDRLAIYHPLGLGWSAMRVCGPAGEPNCASTTVSANPVFSYGRYTLIPKATLGLTNQTNATVTLRNTGGGTAGFEGLMLLSGNGTTPLTPGYYEETEQSTAFNLTYNGTDTLGDGYGGWSPLAFTGARGGSMVYTTSRTATAQFRVIPDNIDGIVLYYSGGLGDLLSPFDDYANMEVFSGGDCTVGANCFIVQNPAVAGYLTGNRVFIPNASLGITGAAPATITLRTQTEGRFVGLEALHIISSNLTTAPSNLPTLPAGRSAANSTNLRYIGSWITYNGPEPLQDVLTYSNDPSAAVMFQVNNAEGIALWRVLNPVYGNFEICINGNTCQTFTSLDAATLWSRRVFLRAQTGTQHVVEIRNLSAAFIGVESIDVLAPQTTLSPAIYDETDPALKYTAGNWFPYSALGLYGGTALYTNDPNATVSFKVDAATTESIGVYYSAANTGDPASSWVPLRVCNGATCQQTTDQGLPYTNGLFRLFTRAELGLTTGEATITISRGSIPGYIVLEGIEVRGAVGPLAPGFYQENNYNLTYTNPAQWLTAVDFALYSGGSSIYTQTPGASVSFTLDANASGFTIHALRFPLGAALEVCYTRQDGSPVQYCSTDLRPVTTNDPLVTQYFYGYAFYGLQPGAPHTVTIRHDGTAGQYVLIDGITVLRSATTTLSVPVNEAVARYDDNDAAIVYDAQPFWVETTFPGYYQNTLHYSFYAGATAQFRIQGNSATIYQPAWSSGSRNVRYCLVVDIGNSTTDDNVDCSEFSQNDPITGLQLPITLYGFGFGTHNLVLENRDYGFYFIMDAVEIR